MEKSDVKQCHRFLQGTELQLVPCAEFLRMKSLDIAYFKTAWGIVTGFTPMMFQYIHQTQGSLAYQMPMSFSKEHVIY